MQNKHLKELQDRRKNWVFMTPEELVTGKSLEETLDGKGQSDEGKEKALVSPMERYLQNLYLPKTSKNRSSSNAKTSSPFASGKDDANADSDSEDDLSSDLPPGMRETQRSLQKSLRSGETKNRAAQRKNSSIFSDVFALEREKPSVAEEEMEKARLEAYKRSLGLAATPVFSSKSMAAFADPNDPVRTILNPGGVMDSSPGGSQANGAGPKSSGVSGVPNSLFSDSASKAAGASSLTPVLPKAAPQKSLLPPQPTFAAPRRSF
jgi:hypothetical protein